MDGRRVCAARRRLPESRPTARRVGANGPEGLPADARPGRPAVRRRLARAGDRPAGRPGALDRRRFARDDPARRAHRRVASRRPAAGRAAHNGRRVPGPARWTAAWSSASASTSRTSRRPARTNVVATPSRGRQSGSPSAWPSTWTPAATVSSSISTMRRRASRIAFEASRRRSRRSFPLLAARLGPEVDAAVLREPVDLGQLLLAEVEPVERRQAVLELRDAAGADQR